MASDADLIGRVIARDDKHAFAELVRRHQSRLRTLLRRLTAGDDATADDLAQETFINAYRAMRRYRGGAKFSTWLYRIAYNAFASQARRRQPILHDVHELADRAAGSEHDAADARHDLAAAMLVLSPAERAAIALVYGEDLSHSEAAKVLDCPLGTLKTHVSRAKEKLRVQFETRRPAAAANAMR